jgi:MFS family permease
MFSRLRNFPKQFWLVAVGVLISSIGSSMIWPFQLIYASKVLNQPIATVATLISISSFTGMAVSFLGGSIAAYLLMSRATTYVGLLIPMTIMGTAMPFHSIGSDAMMADLIPQEERNRAYSILRMVNNAGIAIGPGIGGFIVTRSYSLAFYGAAIGMLTYSLILLLFVRETLNTCSTSRCWKTCGTTNACWPTGVTSVSSPP